MIGMKTGILCFCLILISGTAHAQQRLSVSAPEANIRSGPGNNFDVLWKAEKYFPFHLIKKSAEWFNIRDYDGDEGWVHQSLVGNTESVITTKDKCNLRSEPKPDARVLFSVGPGVPFKVIKRSNKWILVEHADGDKGWIHESVIW